MPAAALPLVLCVIAAIGCGNDGPRPAARRQGTERVGGDVVATVDGVGVTTADVERLATEADLDARAALEALEERELLAAEAERRGHADDPAVRIATRRAMVQALLAREVEARITPEGIPEAEVRERWRDAERYHRPERRASKHVLARLPPDADEATAERARALAAEAIAELRAAGAGGPGTSTQVDAVLGRWRGQTRDGIAIIAEALPPMARDAQLEEGYRDAMFSVDAPGVVPEPARTSYGWHAVVVTEILPAQEVPFEEAEPELREQMATERRRARVESLLRSLRERYEVRIDEDRVRAALSRDLLSEARTEER